MKLSVIIPAYNEVQTIATVIDQVRNCGLSDLEIIVVNDCSNDGTREILEAMPPSPDLKIFHHERNQGKGAAIRSAQKMVTGDVVIIQDADLEYSPAEFPTMIKPLLADKADAVFGSRYSGREILVDTFWHYFGNKVLTLLSNICSNLNLSDMETCYKMIRADLFTSFTLECNRFGFEPEITAKLARRRARIYEVPIAYEARCYDEGKKIGWRDGVAAIWYILKYNLFCRD
ncbi:MAG: glycosyltransferase family 2 protein [Lentisphaerae bacterium]|nr:glycosyltransferase family 2 protein [Lentisphaerota bacterium]